MFYTIYCPNCFCKLKLTIKNNVSANIKQQWIKCPKCAERFHPLLDKQTLDSLANNQTVENLDWKTTSLTFPRISGKSKTPCKVHDQNYLLPEQLPLPAISYGFSTNNKLYLAFSGFAVIILLIALSVVFDKAQAPVVASAIKEVNSVEPAYGPKQVRHDLLALRRELMRTQHIEKIINYKGREVNIFKYFMMKLAPQKCKDLLSLSLWSPRTNDGFRIKAACMNTKEPIPELIFYWNREKVIVSSVEAKNNEEIYFDFPS